MDIQLFSFFKIKLFKYKSLIYNKKSSILISSYKDELINRQKAIKYKKKIC